MTFAELSEKVPWSRDKPKNFWIKLLCLLSYLDRQPAYTINSDTNMPFKQLNRIYLGNGTPLNDEYVNTIFIIFNSVVLIGNDIRPMIWLYMIKPILPTLRQYYQEIFNQCKTNGISIGANNGVSVLVLVYYLYTYWYYYSYQHPNTAIS